jgi:hypothetical protein
MPRKRLGPEDLTADELADRLNLLLDFSEAARGEPVTYAEIASFVEAQGSALSRAKWSYMTAGGGRRNKDLELLAALARFFEIDPAFLTSKGEVPDRIKAQLELVQSLRANKVRSFAARTFRGELSSTALDAIARILAEETAKAEGDPE